MCTLTSIFCFHSGKLVYCMGHGSAFGFHIGVWHIWISSVITCENNNSLQTSWHKAMIWLLKNIEQSCFAFFYLLSSASHNRHELLFYGKIMYIIKAAYALEQHECEQIISKISFLGEQFFFSLLSFAIIHPALKIMKLKRSKVVGFSSYLSNSSFRVLGKMHWIAV